MNIKPVDSNIVQTALRYAKNIRLCSDFKRFKLGACIFNNKKVLVGGSNTNKTCPSQFKYNHFRHFDNVDYREVNACCHAKILPFCNEETDTNVIVNIKDELYIYHIVYKGNTPETRRPYRLQPVIRTSKW